VITLEKAKNLKGKDKNGLSDPYVILKFHEKSGKTKCVKKKNINPMWKESFVIVLHRNWQHHKLEMEVKDLDFVGKDDELGFTELKLSEMIEDEEKEIDVNEEVKVFEKKLNEKKDTKESVGECGTIRFIVSLHGKEKEPSLTSGKHFEGHVASFEENIKNNINNKDNNKKINNNNIKKSEKMCYLVITIDHAKNLKGKDSNKLSDPFVIIEVDEAKKLKTKIIKKTINPVWHESFMIPLDGDWKDKKLKLNVKDSDFAKSDDLGIVVFDLKDIYDDEKKKNNAVSTITKDLIGEDVSGNLTFHISMQDKEIPEFNHGKQFAEHIPHLITNFIEEHIEHKEHKEQQEKKEEKKEEEEIEKKRRERRKSECGEFGFGSYH